MRRLDEMTKEDIVRVIVETTQNAADGYRRSHCEHCHDGAIASSNTGYFILTAFGFSGDEIREMFAEHNSRFGATL